MSRRLLASAFLVALSIGSARQASSQGEYLYGDVPNKLINRHLLQDRRWADVASGAPTETTWVGHSIQNFIGGDPTTYSYGPYHVGRGLNLPGGLSGDANYKARNSGVWTWDHFAAGESDSLQGWTPMRRAYNITGGWTIQDTDRPWWAIDVGNQGNAAPIGPNQRTRGVISYWHVDAGSLFSPGPFDGHAMPVMTWLPIVGSGSAWCGLRAHGDFNYIDPITTNPYNQSVLEYNGENAGSVGVGGGIGTSKRFPGYPSQMDQILYRDVAISGPGVFLTLSFLYSSAMSAAAGRTAATRTGWFEYDPTTNSTVAAPGPNAGAPNYVSNTGVGTPADRFSVYIGAPTRVGSSVFLANGSFQPIYDIKRRWLSEVIRLDAPIVNAFTLNGPGAGLFPVTAFDMTGIYNAQSGATRYARIVFRCKTNRGFDDMRGSDPNAFNSGGAGAVLLDDVTIGGAGVAGPAVGISHFEAPAEIDNGVITDDLAMTAWRATGKPPSVYFHNHPLQGGDIGGGNVYFPLNWYEVCGPPGNPARLCNMDGVVVSAGDHDQNESVGGQGFIPPDQQSMDGIVSPTIPLKSTGPGDFNAAGINSDIARAVGDYMLSYDLYAGATNLMFTGCAWTFAYQSYPAIQANGVRCWGELRYPPFQLFDPDAQCLRDVEPARAYGLIRTSNAGCIPDSMRVLLAKSTQCFRFGVAGSACGSMAGLYFDNVSLGFSNPTSGAQAVAASVDPWHWLNDAFPTTEVVAPGTAPFDISPAEARTGLNTALFRADGRRDAIPGDTSVACACEDNGRVDLVFRILPGPGNYFVVGDRNSGLRPTPGVFAIVAPGDGSFWGQYLAAPGAMSKGVHGNPGVAGAGGGAAWWNKNVWNSARCDTAEKNIFPVQSNPELFDTNTNYSGHLNWMACYHEADPKLPVLGVPHPRCFLVAPQGPVTSANIDCAVPPAWLLPAVVSGWDGLAVTTEGTKIIPDGLLTPGAHVEYFFRFQEGIPRNDLAYATVPDTHYVSPQYGEGPSTDGHRWQQFSVLPDRWKDPLFGAGGVGMAVMLYADFADRRGDERAWVSIADTTGATSAAKRGAHNGWRARGDQLYTDPATNRPIDISLDPSIARYDNGGQPGTTWDMYGVKGAEGLTVAAGSLGSRVAFRGGGLTAGKESRQGPTPDMLRFYYPALLLLSADIDTGLLGEFMGRASNEVALLQDYMTVALPGTPATTKRGIYIAGDGFVQSETQTGWYVPAHLNFLSNYLGAAIKSSPGVDPFYYRMYAGNLAIYADLTGAGPDAGNNRVAGNDCLWGDDVLQVVPSALNPTSNYLYEPVGINAPYVAGIYTPPNPPAKFYSSYVEGYDIAHVYSTVPGPAPYMRAAASGPVSSLGRIALLAATLTNLQATLGLVIMGTPLIPLDVPTSLDGRVFTDFFDLRNNPMTNGPATVHFGLAAADRVHARIYDVTGRLVRTLADRVFPPGEHDLTWDGADDRGREVARGVYFTRLEYAKSGFEGTKKLTLLR